MRRSHGPPGALTALLAAALLAACGAVPESPATEPSPPPGVDTTVVAVSLTEWGVEAGPARTAAGAVAFDVANDGALTHDLWVIRTDLPAGELAVRSGIAQTGALAELVVRTGDLSATLTERLSADLDAGRYVLICNIPGHYELGMHAPFTVE